MARREVFLNPSASSWRYTGKASAPHAFHSSLPSYTPTRLVRLDDVASELGVGAVYLKDESNRFGLPSFKVLGASWATYKTIAEKVGLDADTVKFDIEEVKRLAKGLHLFAATDGNHGRAVARMGKIFGVPATIYIPTQVGPAATEAVRREGADVQLCDVDYDESVMMALKAATETPGGLLVQDFAFDGYENIPQWMVEGYLTMMDEIDSQLPDGQVDLVISPVGVGSLAQAVVSHFKSSTRASGSAAVMTVEPDTAACLWKSLKAGTMVSQHVSTPSIMTGLDCGTVSKNAWPILQSGVDASTTVSDFEAHLALEYLRTWGVSAGPCGASPLAALRRLSPEDRTALGLSNNSTIVLLCTEAMREYTVPHAVDMNTTLKLTQALVKIRSVNTSLGSGPGLGESAIAGYIKAWLEYRDIETHWVEEVKGRPSVVGIVRGSGGGKTLMLNGHIDTVSTEGYKDDPLSGKLSEDGKRIFGRGSGDMKGGVAAAMIALNNAISLGLRGDVLFTGVADEEATSIGTEQILRAGWRADAAIIGEPTNLDIVHGHKGFIWFDVEVSGVAAHGSRPDLGTDAIMKAADFLKELQSWSQERGHCDGTKGLYDRPSLHASLIKGGTEVSSYPDSCTISLEYRTVPGQTPESVTSELRALLDKMSQADPKFRSGLRATFHRPAYELPQNHPFAQLLAETLRTDREPTLRKETFWTDAALLSAKGIPTLIWGPIGVGIHSEEEWVDVASIDQVAKTLTEVLKKFCA